MTANLMSLVRANMRELEKKSTTWYSFPLYNLAIPGLFTTTKFKISVLYCYDDQDLFLLNNGRISCLIIPTTSDINVKASHITPA